MAPVVFVVLVLAVVAGSAVLAPQWATAKHQMAARMRAFRELCFWGITILVVVAALLTRVP